VAIPTGVSSLSNPSQIAQILAGSPAAFDSHGLQTPPEVTQAIMAMLMGPGAVAGASEEAPAASAALETSPETLPAIPAGAKAGDPHALFAYKDNWGPDMTERNIYNVFGDVTHPAIQKVGWGSSVPEEVLQQHGIPIIGRQM
jgi:hypothetical protein